MVAKIATGEIEEEPKAAGEAAGGYSNSATATCAVDRHVVDILRYSLLIFDSPERPLYLFVALEVGYKTTRASGGFGSFSHVTKPSRSAFSALAASGQISMLITVGPKTVYCRKCRSSG
jgi:hypothetical protein